MLALARHEEPAVGRHDVRREQVVQREAEPPRQIPDAASERETRHAGGRDDPAGRRQAERVGGRVEVAPGRTALSSRRRGGGIDADPSHPGEVDHDAAVARAEARDAVSAPADREVQPVLARRVHRRDDVACVLGSHDHERLPIDHRVVDAPRVLVALVVRRDHVAPHLLAERVHRQRAHRSPPVLGPVRGHACCSSVTHPHGRACDGPCEGGTPGPLVRTCPATQDASMGIAVHLLGPPLLVRDDVVYPAPLGRPRGRKVWGLFAYLALSDRSPTRQQLIDLLFPDADDPAGALRWNLSELRRLLGGPDAVGSGNVVQLRLPEGSILDVRVLMEGTSFEAVELPGLGRELLEGMDIESSPGFSAWLLGERRRLQALGEAVLREGALRGLASGNARKAVELATRLVAAAPLDEDAHVLLLRAFAGTGDEVAVQRQLAASIELFRRELGIEPGPELVEAASDHPADAGGRRTWARGAADPRGIGRVRRERGGDRGRCRGPARSRRSLSRSGRDRPRSRSAARLRLGPRPRHEGEGRGGSGRAPPEHRGRGGDRGSSDRGRGAPRARVRRDAPR